MLALTRTDRPGPTLAGTDLAVLYFRAKPKGNLERNVLGERIVGSWEGFLRCCSRNLYRQFALNIVPKVLQIQTVLCSEPLHYGRCCVFVSQICGPYIAVQEGIYDLKIIKIIILLPFKCKWPE